MGNYPVMRRMRGPAISVRLKEIICKCFSPCHQLQYIVIGELQSTLEKTSEQLATAREISGTLEAEKCALIKASNKKYLAYERALSESRKKLESAYAKVASSFCTRQKLTFFNDYSPKDQYLFIDYYARKGKGSRESKRDCKVCGSGSNMKSNKIQ